MSAIQFARLLALVNVRHGRCRNDDLGIKYYYDFWRPVLGIRERIWHRTTGLGDGNPDTVAMSLFAVRRAC